MVLYINYIDIAIEPLLISLLRLRDRAHARSQARHETKRVPEWTPNRTSDTDNSVTQRYTHIIYIH